MMPSARPSPIYSSTTGRSWFRLDKNAFSTALPSSQPCRPVSWSALDVDELAQLYDTEITCIAEGMVSKRTVRFIRRSSDPWFDDDCRAAKRCVRHLEREVRRADPADAAVATNAWRVRRREYKELRQQKRESFWKSKVDTERLNPQQLWKSINTSMGRGQVPSSTTISADKMHSYFDGKVAGVRASTSDASFTVGRRASCFPTTDRR